MKVVKFDTARLILKMEVSHSAKCAPHFQVKCGENYWIQKDQYHQDD